MRLEAVKRNDEDLRIMLESGIVLREMGRLDEAEQIFFGVHELVPESDVPFVALSSIAVRRGDFDKALYFCEEGLRCQPESLYARVNHAEILLYQKKREEAEAELHEIIETAPESPHSRTAQSLLEVAQMIPEAA